MSTTTVVRLCNAPTPPPARFTNHRRRRRSPNPNFLRSRLQPKQQLTDDTFPYTNKPVWGNVRILKRGEPLPAGSCLINKESRLEQTTVKESFFFAGGVFLASPSPSLLPLPGFLAKKTFSM